MSAAMFVPEPAVVRPPAGSGTRSLLSGAHLHIPEVPGDTDAPDSSFTTSSRTSGLSRCDLHHDGHSCRQPGACGRALLAWLDRTRPRRLIDNDTDPTPAHGLERREIPR